MHQKQDVASIDEHLLHALSQALEAGGNAGEHGATKLELLHNPSVRRALRHLLPSLPADQATTLARWLLIWQEDFHSLKRDFSTWQVILALDDETLYANAVWLAESNAALAFWERVARVPEQLRLVAERILRESSTQARETMLVLLLLEPAGICQLPTEEARVLLAHALKDHDPALRGLAARLALASAPDLLSAQLAQGIADPESAGMRAACWAVAFTEDAEHAREYAASLLGDNELPAEIRISALDALAQHLSTSEIAPLLAVLVSDVSPMVAEAAARILWQLHRHPLAAQAALDSPYASVRAIGQRLLDPRRGSPAAGGNRPGAPS